MKTNDQIETELRGIFSNAKWDKHFTKTASKLIEEIRKENGFGEFTTKERVAILESIAQALMNYNVQHFEKIKELKRNVLFLMAITGILAGIMLGILIKAITG